MNKDVIIMEYPAKPEYLLSLRLVTSSITSRLGLDIEQIEDTKIAVSEACTMVMQHFTEEDRLLLRFEIDSDLFVYVQMKQVSKDTVQAAQESPEALELSQYLLEALMDEVHVARNDAGRVSAITLIKRIDRFKGAAV